MGATGSEVDHPGPRSSVRAHVMVQSLAQPVATNVFKTFRHDEAVLPGAPGVARDKLRCDSIRCSGHTRRNCLSGRGHDSYFVLTKGGVHHPVEVHDGGIEAPHGWGYETPVSFVHRYQNRMGHTEAMARRLPHRCDDQTVRPPDDKRRGVSRVRPKTAFDPSWLHQHRQASPIKRPQLLRKDVRKGSCTTCSSSFSSQSWSRSKCASPGLGKYM